MRKQTAEKDASKCLTRIKKLLQAYALARPNVRLQLRVLKAKNDKMNFAYGPKAGGEASVRDAAWKVVGSEPASQCAWSVLEAGGFELQALLPTSEAAASKISGVGHFVSIDRRPVSTVRGTPKQICKLVVEKIRESGPSLAGVKDPFFVVNIACPQGSYDPNVEPAKDDVLLHDVDAVLQAVRELLGAVYPSLAEVDKTGGDEGNSSIIDEPRLRPTETREELPAQLLEDMVDEAGRDNEEPDRTTRERVMSMALEQGAEGPAEEDGTDLIDYPEPIADELEVLQNRANIWRSPMHDFDEDDLELFELAAQQRGSTDNEELEPEQIDMRDINPWTIAKMNITRRSVKEPKTTADVDPGGLPVQRQRPRGRSLSPALSRPLYDSVPGRMMTSEFSDDMQTTRSIRPRQQPDYLSFGSDQVHPDGGRGRLQMHGGLPTPMPSSSPARPSPPQRSQHAGWNQRQKQANATLTKAFKPPKQHRDPTGAVFEGPAGNGRPARRDRRLNEMWQGPSLPNSLPVGPMGEPADHIPAAAMHPTPQRTETPLADQDAEDDFRARLRAAGEQLDTQYNSSTTAARSVPASDPSLDVVHGGWTPVNPPQESRPESQALPQSAKRRRTTEGRRSKSSRLPLERVPDGCEVHQLIQSLTMSSAELESLLFKFPLSPLDHVDWQVSPADLEYRGIREMLQGEELCCVARKAIDMIGEKLEEAEQANDEESALALVGVLTRLERSGSDEAAD